MCLPFLWGGRVWTERVLGLKPCDYHLRLTGLSNQWRALHKPSEKPGCMSQSRIHIGHQERTRNKNYSLEEIWSQGHEITRQRILVKWKIDPDLVWESWIILPDGIAVPPMASVKLKFRHIKDQGQASSKMTPSKEGGQENWTHTPSHMSSPVLFAGVRVTFLLS